MNESNFTLYVQFAVLEESLTMHKPEALSFEEASAIPETWFTAYQALFFVGEMKKGQDVLIHAGASGVGIAAIQLAKEAGAQVIIGYKPSLRKSHKIITCSNRIFVTVGSDEKVKFCESIGATKAINYKTENWSDVVSVTLIVTLIVSLYRADADDLIDFARN